MTDEPISIIILAAGAGKRMESSLPKVLHLFNGKPMARLLLEQAIKLQPTHVVLVVGHGAEQVKAEFAKDHVLFATQSKPLGTADAVKCGLNKLADFHGDVLVLCGDVPLITHKTLKNLQKKHQSLGSAITMLSMNMKDPTGYGRILRTEGGAVIGNVEQEDATEPQRKITEVNGGLYIFKASFLQKNIGQIKADNAQAEFYLPDLIALAVKQSAGVEAVNLGFTDELCGVNSQQELKRLEGVLCLE